MIVFLWDEFNIRVTNCSISRTLVSVHWSKKIARQKTKEHNSDLRDIYTHYISDFRFYHLIYVDESECDKRIDFRRTDWSSLNMTPVQISKFHRDQYYQILPAYAQDDIIISRVFQNSIDTVAFEDFIEQFLEYCERWPEPKFVLVMNNILFHHSEQIEHMCLRAEVKLIYLSSYSPDRNPIEEFFAELKDFIKRNWSIYEKNPSQDFDNFLEWCVDIVDSREQSAQNHFRNASLTIDEI